jgi:hypothetical protein
MDSYRHQIYGFKDAMEKLGDGTVTIADANFDVKRQTDQIVALAASKPDALIVLPQTRRSIESDPGRHGGGRASRPWCIWRFGSSRTGCCSATTSTPCRTTDGRWSRRVCR